MSLTISSLNKSFAEKTLFRDFSYKFDPTGIYAVCGESGIGKSTLLRMIAGLDTDYTGTIEGGGISAVSVCFQEHRLFPNLTALENVFKVFAKKPSKEDKDAAKAILSRLKFTELDMHLKPHELSGGMRQRVSFSRAILKESRILILDEATKELDKALADTVLSIIKEESKRRLVIIVTHKSDEIDALGARIIDLSNLE